MASSRLRLIAAKPCPPEVNVVPRKCTSMSSQRANSRRMDWKISRSACSMPPRVSSEKTTPKPNVSSAAFRSQTVMSCRASSCLASAAKYSPPGPPPRTAIRTVLLLLASLAGASLASGGGSFRACRPRSLSPDVMPDLLRSSTERNMRCRAEQAEPGFHRVAAGAAAVSHPSVPARIPPAEREGSGPSTPGRCVTARFRGTLAGRERVPRLSWVRQIRWHEFEALGCCRRAQRAVEGREFRTPFVDAAHSQSSGQLDCVISAKAM